MQRRSLLWLGALSPLAWFDTRYLSARSKTAPRTIDTQAKALELNELASNIRTEADAGHLVDFVANLFSEEVPSAWRSGRLRRQLAKVEFGAVSNPQNLVPEVRLAESWNSYVETIGAPTGQKASPAEIHNMRDALYVSARLLWQQPYKNFWAVPSLYATQADGTLSAGCRAIESVRILWDLANMPDNLKAAQERMKNGKLFSDLVGLNEQPASTPKVGASMVVGRVSTNWVQTAARDYIGANGRKAWSHAVVTMIDRILA